MVVVLLQVPADDAAARTLPRLRCEPPGHASQGRWVAAMTRRAEGERMIPQADLDAMRARAEALRVEDMLRLLDAYEELLDKARAAGLLEETT